MDAIISIFKPKNPNAAPEMHAGGRRRKAHRKGSRKGSRKAKKATRRVRRH